MLNCDTFKLQPHCLMRDGFGDFVLISGLVSVVLEDCML